METNNLADLNLNGYEYHARKRQNVGMRHPDLVRITRLRLISDPGYPWWDLSYCYGELRDGTEVRVQLDRYEFSKRFLKRELVQMCKDAGVFLRDITCESVISKCQ